MNNIFSNEIILHLLGEYKPIWSLQYLRNLASWDLETYMPEGGATDRGYALAKSASLIQKLFLDDHFVNLINTSKRIYNDLNDYEKGVVRILSRELDIFNKLPSKFIEEFEKTSNESQIIWRKARDEDNYEIFEPYLQKIVNLNIRKANYLEFKEHPYDALLDQFEEGQTTSFLDEYFDNLIPQLKSIYQKINTSSKFLHSHPISKAKYSSQELKKINWKILKYFNLDTSRLRLDESSHPFTASLHSSDVRITTRYHDVGFFRSLSSTIHEYGHALYDLQCSTDLNYSPIFGGTSLGIHESQSSILGKT